MAQRQQRRQRAREGEAPAQAAQQEHQDEGDQSRVWFKLISLHIQVLKITFVSFLSCSPSFATTIPVPHP